MQKSIYILLTRSNTLLSKLINLSTCDPYTHAAISFDEKLDFLYSFARKYSALALPAGLVQEHLDKGCYAKTTQMPCALLEVKVNESDFERAKNMADEMYSHLKNYKYSIIGLFLCKMGVDKKRKGKYFCSQFVSEMLKAARVDLPKPAGLMRPIDFDLMDNLSCRFRGSLFELMKKISFRRELTSKCKLTAQSLSCE